MYFVHLFIFPMIYFNTYCVGMNLTLYVNVMSIGDTPPSNVTGERSLVDTLAKIT